MDMSEEMILWSHDLHLLANANAKPPETSISSENRKVDEGLIKGYKLDIYKITNWIISPFGVNTKKYQTNHHLDKNH